MEHRPPTVKEIEQHLHQLLSLGGAPAGHPYAGYQQPYPAYPAYPYPAGYPVPVVHPYPWMPVALPYTSIEQIESNQTTQSLSSTQSSSTDQTSSSTDQSTQSLSTDQTSSSTNQSTSSSTNQSSSSTNQSSSSTNQSSSSTNQSTSSSDQLNELLNEEQARPSSSVDDDDDKKNDDDEEDDDKTTTEQQAFPHLDEEEPVEWPSSEAMEQLHRELEGHLRSVQPFDQRERRARFVNDLNRLVRRRWPEHRPQLHLFGSTANDLCVGRGDIDLCLTIDEQAGSRVEVIEQLGELLIEQRMQHVQVLNKARIPIVKFRDPRSKFACDVCCNNTLALRNTRMLADYARIDARMRPLVFAVKSWAKRRLLNDPYHGSLSSYAYVLLVVFYLQTRSPPVLPCLQQLHRPDDPALLPRVEDYDVYYYTHVDRLARTAAANPASVVELLLGFFRYYGWQFDFEQHVVSVRLGRPLPRHEKGWTALRVPASRRFYYIAIEDPFEHTHNLGKSVGWRAFRLLAREFRRAYRTLATHSLRSAYRQAVPRPAIVPARTQQQQQE